MKANERHRGSYRPLALLLSVVVGCQGVLKAGDGPIVQATSSSQAKELAIRAHAQAAAIDKLPRFSIRAHAGTVGEGRFENPAQEPVENLLRALDEPTTAQNWFRFLPTFAWDERHFLIGSQHADDAPESNNLEDILAAGAFWWGTGSLSGQRTKALDAPAQHVLWRDAAALWKNHDVSQPNYLLATRHEFWWGDNGHHTQHFGSGVPPSHSLYRSLGSEDFDGERCDVVESATRQERLWISQANGLIRGYLHFSYHGPLGNFYESEAVKQIAGRSFATQLEYSNWHQSEFQDLPADKKWEFMKAWSDSMDFETAPPSLFVRFRDFREIAPGIWWPFREDRAQVREDRAQGSLKKAHFEYMRSEYLVDEVRTDIDLSEIINALQPKEGERVQDQRYAEIVNYDYRADRTEADILALVAEAFLKRIEGEEILKRLKEPIEKLVGSTAPPLPDDGWVGGPRPDVAGRAYLVHFWATWCGPCKSDFPLLQRMADQGAPLVGMHPAGTSVEEVARVIEEANLGYPTFVAQNDNRQPGTRTIAGYPAEIFPYYILVDAQGKVVAHGSLHENNSKLVGQFRELRDQSRKIGQ